MGLIKLFLKFLVLPVIAVFTLIQWFSIFLTTFSEVIFHLLAGLIFLIALLSCLLGLCPVTESMQMLSVGFAVFVIPHIVEWLLLRIASIRYVLGEFIRS